MARVLLPAFHVLSHSATGGEIPLATPVLLRALGLPELEAQAGVCLKCQEGRQAGKLQPVFRGSQNNKGKLPLNTDIKITLVQEVQPAEGCARCLIATQPGARAQAV